MLIWFLGGFTCAAAALVVAAYFKFMSLRKAVFHARMRLEACLKMRRELIPSLALSGAGMQGLERDFVYALGHLKDPPNLAGGLSRRIAEEAEISQSLQKLFAAAQDLAEKDGHFAHLQQGVASAEHKIEQCKKRYNSAVRDFNTLSAVFPLNCIAKLMELETLEYFDFEPSLKK